MVSIRDCVHSGWCASGMVSIRDGVHPGWCPFGMVSIRDSVHSGLCPFGIVPIRDCVHLGSCTESVWSNLQLYKVLAINDFFSFPFPEQHCSNYLRTIFHNPFIGLSRITCVTTTFKLRLWNIYFFYCWLCYYISLQRLRILGYAGFWLQDNSDRFDYYN